MLRILHSHFHLFCFYFFRYLFFLLECLFTRILLVYNRITSILFFYATVFIFPLYLSQYDWRSLACTRISMQFIRSQQQRLIQNDNTNEMACIYVCVCCVENKSEMFTLRYALKLDFVSTYTHTHIVAIHIFNARRFAWTFVFRFYLFLNFFFCSCLCLHFVQYLLKCIIACLFLLFRMLDWIIFSVKCISIAQWVSWNVFCLMYVWFCIFWLSTAYRCIVEKLCCCFLK